MEKYLIVGDTHGCYKEAKELIDPYKDTHKTIFLGDLIDKHILGVPPLLKYAYEIGSQSIIGNHEQKYLKWRQHEDKKIQNPSYKNPMKDHSDLFEGYRLITQSEHQDHIDYMSWMLSWPYFIRLPEYNLVCIHAGLEPGKSPEKHPHDTICRVRNIDPQTNKMVRLSLIDESKHPHWADMYQGEYGTIVYGHSPWNEPKLTKHTWGIDTGAVYGNKLTGLLLPEFKLISVPSQKYAERNW